MKEIKEKDTAEEEKEYMFLVLQELLAALPDTSNEDEDLIDYIYQINDIDTLKNKSL